MSLPWLRFKWYVLVLFILSGYTSMAQALMDTVADYSQLRFYQGSADTVFVNHPRYHGRFRRSVCLTEDYGTTIIGPTTCWRRITNNFSPRFWALPGPAPDQQIGRVEREVDAINSAAFAAYLVGGDTVEINRIYIIDRPVWLFPHNTYLGTKDSCGFARIDPPKTILTDTAHLNDNSIQVADNTSFRDRQLINIVTGQAFDSLSGHVSYRASMSPVLGGDTIIWLSGRRVQRQMFPGDTVSLFYPMMEQRFNLSLHGVRLENLIFAGNRSAYNLNFDWRVNTTIKMSTAAGIVIDNCRFYDIPTENMVLCGATIQNCRASQLNGSFTHISCNASAPVTNILYNTANNTNEVGNDIMRHSEAAITFSAKVQNLRVAYNDLREVGEHGIGIFKNDDSFNEITDNVLQVAKDSVSFQLAYLYPETNLIYNNKFPAEADTTKGNCWLSTPKVVGVLPCQGRSNLEQPFQLGDTLVLYVDSLQFRRSEENFVKWLRPRYDTSYFRLVDMHLQTSTLSEFHRWVFDTTLLDQPALMFDNGHRSGPLGEGNWGYALCGEAGGCTYLALSFEVVKLPPDSAQAVACPIQGLEFAYDGDLGSWTSTPACARRRAALASSGIGRPVLAGELAPIVRTDPLFEEQELIIYPNPARTYLELQYPPGVAAQLTVLDPLNRIVKQKINPGRRIDISTLAPGAYLIRLELEGKILIQRFIKL